MKCIYNNFSVIFYILIIILILITENSYSQTKFWRNYYISTDSAECIGSAQNRDYTVITGKVKSTISGWDVHTIYYQIWSGFQQNAMVYSTDNNEEPVDIATDINDRTVYVLCRKSDSTGKSNILVLKYSPGGGLIWAKEFDSKNGVNDIPVSLDYQSSAPGNKFLYITSHSVSGAEEGIDILTQKIDTSGNLLWSSYFNDSLYAGTNDIPVKIKSAPDNSSTYIAGTSTDTSGYSQTIIIKYDSSGNLLWKENFGTAVPRNNYSTTLELRNGKLALGGIIEMENNLNYLILLYDTTGNLQWSQIYNGPGNGDDLLSDIGIDQLGNVVVTGSSFVDSLRNNDYCTVKFFPNGDTSWVNFYNGQASGNDRAVTMIIDNFNCIFVTGKAMEVNGYFSYGSILYSTFGFNHWIRNFQAPNISGDNIPVSVTKEQFSNAFTITGNTFGIVSVNSFTTIFYSGIIDDIYENSSENAAGYILNQNYPNPYNPKTIINYQLNRSGEILLKVYDALGNEITTLVNTKQNAGNYIIEFDGNNLSSGVYYYTLISGSNSTTRKMVLLK